MEREECRAGIRRDKDGYPMEYRDDERIDQIVDFAEKFEKYAFANTKYLNDTEKVNVWGFSLIAGSLAAIADEIEETAVMISSLDDAVQNQLHTTR